MSGDSHSDLRIAVVHEWLESYAGSEKVLEQMLQVLPDADLLAVVDFLPPERRGFLGGRTVRTSFIQKLPLARRHFRKYLPLMPRAVERLDVSDYDLVVSNSHAVAKGVRTRPDQLHLCYCHTPMRYAWAMPEEYLGAAGLARGLRGLAARALLKRLRRWDLRAASRVTAFAANSRFVAERIRQAYGREARVIHPPVDVGRFALCERKEDFYLSVSRLVPYKRVDLLVEAFGRLGDRRLVVIGDGPQLGALRARAGDNVTLLDYQDDASLADHLRRARALVFAGVEDFGIVPVEAQACGTPVVALGRGGVTETVLPGQTGLLFDEQTVECLLDAVRMFESAGSFDPRRCRENALRFDVPRFREQFARFVADEQAAFASRRSAGATEPDRTPRG